MIIFGIGGILNDAACAVLKDGQLVAAIEQSKLGRHHRPGQLPDESITACLQLAGITPKDVDCVAIVRPLAAGPEGRIHLELRARFPKSQIVLVEHQVA
ncbi:MAG: carbamoyltransferase, partial [bacterium]|nr:carbamoyltransferase [bacterium]